MRLWFLPFTLVLSLHGGCGECAGKTGAELETCEAGQTASSSPATDVGRVDPWQRPADCKAPAAYGPLSAVSEGIPATGLRLWLRADVGVSVDDGGHVCAWEDQSGSGHDIHQDTVAARPTKLAELNGKPAVDIDPTQHLDRADVLQIAAHGGRTIVAAYALDNVEARFGIVQGQLDTNWAWLGLDDNTYVTSGKRYGCYVPTTSFDGDVTATTDVRVRSLLVDSLVPNKPLSTNFRCRVDGADLALTATAQGGTPIRDFNGANVTQVGWSFGTLGDARIAELLIYDHALPLDDLRMLERTLGTRYGVAFAR